MSITESRDEVLTTDYQRQVANWWDTRRGDRVNLALGEIDGFYHHHYGVGAVDLSVLEGPEATRDERTLKELHRLEHSQAELLLDHLGPIGAGDRLLDAGSGRGGLSFLANQRFGCQVDGVSISQYQVDFANEQARQRGVTDQVRFHFRNMLNTQFPDASRQGIWTDETTMYVDLFDLYAEFSRLLPRGGRYVCITGCYNDTLGDRSDAVATIDEHYNCRIHPRSRYFAALAANNLVPVNVFDLTDATIPYWELREKSSIATGIEEAFLAGYRERSFQYLLISADRV
jgi:geranyl diphosphate 2-C-methyltransferase